VLWMKSDKRERKGAHTLADLREIAGLTARLQFAEGMGQERMTSLTCTISHVGRSEIGVAPLRPEVLPKVQSAVILEVTTLRALLQCFTTVKSVSRDGHLILHRPAHPHVVQRRRFPRIELFVGVTVRTPDRPIEPIAAQLINLSLEGCACVMVEPMAPGTSVTVNLAELGLHPSEAEAEVVRCWPTPSHLWVMGLQFRNLTPEQELYLGKYIADFAEQRPDL
jgi:hypothetical protein